MDDAKSARLEQRADEPRLSPTELDQIHAYWRAANCLSVGQIYLYDNPLLREPLKAEHVKPRLLGHWGTTTTPFDMTVLNDLDRFHLAGDVIDRVPRLTRAGVHAKQSLRNQRIRHEQYITVHGDDMPEIRDWQWPY